ncbi:MAG: Holliday junction branch migration protein RuvA [Candidatus Eremiobacterota bacterium]
MIAYVRGPVAEVSRGLCVVDVGGVGLAVKVPDSLSDRTEVGQQVHLATFLGVREDDLSLYGFGSSRERELFKLLLSISGVGPKLALKVLSALPPGELIAALLEEDVRGLTRVPGVGTKTAKRLIVELSEKIAGLAVGEAETPAGLEREAMDVLVGLGCSRDEAIEALSEARGRVGEAEVGVDRLVMEALRVLGERG